jgi:hypothetical protein
MNNLIGSGFQLLHYNDYENLDLDNLSQSISNLTVNFSSGYPCMSPNLSDLILLRDNKAQKMSDDFEKAICEIGPLLKEMHHLFVSERNWTVNNSSRPDWNVFISEAEQLFNNAIMLRFLAAKNSLTLNENDIRALQSR